MNESEERAVTIITGRVWREKGEESEGVHIMLLAPDDDTAVRLALEALAREGARRRPVKRQRSESSSIGRWRMLA